MWEYILRNELMPCAFQEYARNIKLIYKSQEKLAEEFSMEREALSSNEPSACVNVATIFIRNT
jgi:hypothetical protein